MVYSYEPQIYNPKYSYGLEFSFLLTVVAEIQYHDTNILPYCNFCGKYSKDRTPRSHI